MENFDRKAHWEKVYSTKQIDKVSWFQPTPASSLRFLEELRIPTTAKIIDVGGGDSFLVDRMLEKGYSDITVLDISERAIERAKQRLGEKSAGVKWIVADAAQFEPVEQYDFWHDRAAFHFLTHEDEISSYVETASRSIVSGGTLVIGTFSEEGPQKCSGIEVKQYSESSMAERLKTSFKKLKCITIDHVTPFQTNQNFIFCSFTKL